MGETTSKPANLWESTFDLESSNSTVGVFKLSERETQDIFVCRKISTIDKKQIQEINRLIQVKLAIESPFITKLEKVQTQTRRQYCAYGLNYYMLFKQPYQTLKQQTLNRKFRNPQLRHPFSEEQLEMLLEVGVKGLLFLKHICQTHGLISSSAFFVQENNSILLGDPFMFPKNEGFSVMNRNAFIYPSPQMLDHRKNQFQQCLSDLFTLGLVLLEVHFTANMDSVYEANFTKLRFPLILEKLNTFKSDSLRKKMFILLDPNPKNREIIFHFFRKPLTEQQTFPERQTQKFMKNVERYNLATSQVTEWKDEFPFENIDKVQSLSTRLSQLQRINSSEGKKTISISTNDPYFLPMDQFHNQNVKSKNQFQRKNHYNPYNNNSQRWMGTEIRNSESKNESLSRCNSAKPENGNFQLLDRFGKVNSYPFLGMETRDTLREFQRSQLSNSPFYSGKKEVMVNYNPSFHEPFQHEYLSELNRQICEDKENYTQKSKQKCCNQFSNKGIAITLNNTSIQTQTLGLQKGTTNKTQFFPVIYQGKQNDKKEQTTNLFQNFRINQLEQSQNKKTQEEVIKTNHKEINETQERSVQKNPGQQMNLEGLNKAQNPKQNYSVLEKKQEFVQYSIEKMLQLAKEVIKQHTTREKLTPKKALKRKSHYNQQYLSTINERSQITESAESFQECQQSFQLPYLSVTKNCRSSTTKNNSESSKLTNKLPQHSNQNQQKIDQGKQSEKMWCIQYPSGTRYEGESKNQKRNGYGTFYYIDGSKYEGGWFDNKMHGFGTLFYPNGKIAYEGQWKLDNFHGEGRVFNDQPIPLQGPYHYQNCQNIEDFWVEYRGQLEEDRREGKGTLKLINGQYLEGSFKNDILDGECKFYCLGGQVVEGIWRKSKLVEIINRNNINSQA